MYVLPQRAGFLCHFGLRMGIDFALFSLELHAGNGFQGNYHKSVRK